MLEKITPEQIEECGVASAPDRLTGNPADVKAVFDRLVKELVAQVVNDIIDAHNGLDRHVNSRIDGVIEELKKISEINADNLGAQNIALDKPGEDTLAKAYGLDSLVPTVYEALAKLSPLGADAVAANLVKLSPAAPYMEHWWMRRGAYTSTGYVTGPVKTTTDTSILTEKLYQQSGYNSTATVAYGDSVRVNPDGTLRVTNTTTVKSAPATCAQDLTVLAGKYVYRSGVEVWYIPQDAVPRYVVQGGIYYVSVSKYQIVTVAAVDREWQYISSADKNAYPANGVKDGYEYLAVGVPLANTPMGLKATHGSYVGDGENGEAYPTETELTFPFVPLVVFVTAGSLDTVVAVRGTPGVTYYGDTYALTWEGNSLTLKNTASTVHGSLDQVGVVYHYVALGI